MPSISLQPSLSSQPTLDSCVPDDEEIADAACRNTTGTIGDQSCRGVNACAMLDRDHVMMRAEVLAVMMEFVKAVKAPILEMTVGNIGDESCTDNFACNENSGDIEDGSCQGRGSCEYNSGKIEGATATERVTEQLAQKARIAAMGNSLVVDLLAMYILTLATVTLHAATQPVLGVTVLEQASLVYHPSLLSLSPKKREI
eukprot:scaffold39152_cov206-Skeletonema_marinoi.AAC.4